MSRSRRRSAALGEHRTGAHATVWVEADPERPSGRTLYIDGFASSYVDLDDPSYLHFAYQRHMAALLDALPAAGQGEVIHIGGGAGSLARYLAATRNWRNVVFERDELVVRMARDLLALHTHGGLQVKVRDGRDGLARRADRSAIAVVIDAFQGPDVPADLLTAAFLHDAHRVLRPDGLYLLNLVDQWPLDTAREVAQVLLNLFADVALITDRAVLRGDDRANLVFAASGSDVALHVLRHRVTAESPGQRILQRRQVQGFAAARGSARAASR